MVEETEDRGFLQRWSRRKQHSDAAEPIAPPQVPVAPEQAPELPAEKIAAESTAVNAGAQAAETDEVILTDEDMPPIESLNGESDYSPFLSEGVSKELRNIALKKLFFSGNFGVRDGLDDYDDDFTRFEPLGNTVTSDMKFHQRRKERERLAKLEEEQKALEEQAQTDDDVSDDSEVEPDAAEQQETIGRDVETDQQQSDDPVDQQPSAVPQITGADPTDRDTVAGGKLHRSVPVTEDHQNDFDRGKDS